MPTCVICLEDEWTDSGEVITCVICTQAYHGECVRSGWVNRACASCRRGVLLLAVRPRDPSAAVEEPPLRRPRFDTKLLPLCCRHLGPPPDFQFLPVRSMRWCPTFRVFHCYGCNREVDPTLGQTYQTVRPSCTRHGSRTLVMDYHGGISPESSSRAGHARTRLVMTWVVWFQRWYILSDRAWTPRTWSMFLMMMMMPW